MNGVPDLLLMGLVVASLYSVATSRLAACVRASALQGVILAALPLALEWQNGIAAPSRHAIALAAAALAIKAIAIPLLLFRTLREAGARREVEPMVSLHASVAAATLLVAFAFWLGGYMIFPYPVGSRWLAPAAIANVLIGFLLVVARRKAVTQVVGYLVLENGVFVFGLGLAPEQPLVVELSLLLDLLVGVFVMGIAINDIGETFEDVDTAALASLRD